MILILIIILTMKIIMTKTKMVMKLKTINKMTIIHQIKALLVLMIQKIKIRMKLMMIKKV
jgi:hypothetical protein